MNRWRVYIIGWEPMAMPPLTERQREVLIRDCDFMLTREGQGVRLGEIVMVSHTNDPSGGPGLGTRMRCVGHELGGKVIVVEPIEGAS